MFPNMICDEVSSASWKLGNEKKKDNAVGFT